MSINGKLFSSTTLADGTQTIVVNPDPTAPIIIVTTPQNGDNISLSYSKDNGINYITLGSVIATTTTPVTSGVTHIKFKRKTGSGTTSKVDIYEDCSGNYVLISDNASPKIMSLLTTPPPTIAVIGDSITDQGAPIDHLGVLKLNSTYGSIAGVNWINWFNYFTGQSFRIVKYSGHSGDSSSQILARTNEITVLNPLPGWVVVESGTNSITGSASSGTITQVISDIKNTCQEFLNLGIRVLLMDLPPSLNLTTTTDAENWVRVNKWCADFSAVTSGVYLWKISDLWVDPAAVAPQAVGTPGIYTADGLHQSTLGAYLIGLRGYNLMNGISPYNIKPFDNFRVFTSTTAKNGVQNPGMVGTAGGKDTVNVTGTVPTYWNIGCYPAGAACTVSQVTRSEQKGMNWLQVAYTGASAGFVNGTDRIEVHSSGITLANLPTEFQITNSTDLVRLIVEVEMDASPTNFRNINAVLQLGGSGGLSINAMFFDNSGSGIGQPLNLQQQAGVFATYPMTMARMNALQPTLTSLALYVYAYASAANSIFTFRVGRAAIVPYVATP